MKKIAQIIAVICAFAAPIVTIPAAPIVTIPAASVAVMTVSIEMAVAETVVCDDNCPVVPEVNYEGGGKVVQTVRAEACFRPDILSIITRPDGTNEWVAAFVYKGGGHERIDTKHNVGCWTHNVAPGTYMAVYVTCVEFTGWVAVKVTGPGRYTMVPVNWDFKPKWM